AGRTSDDQLDLTSPRMSCLKHLARRHVEDAPLYHRPRTVRLQRLAAIRIHLHRYAGVEARSFEAVVETSRTREETDHLWLGHRSTTVHLFRSHGKSHD